MVKGQLYQTILSFTLLRSVVSAQSCITLLVGGEHYSLLIVLVFIIITYMYTVQKPTIQQNSLTPLGIAFPTTTWSMMFDQMVTFKMNNSVKWNLSMLV